MVTWLGCGGSLASAAPVGGAAWSTGAAACVALALQRASKAVRHASRQMAMVSGVVRVVRKRQGGRRGFR
jgi:hypothetical protein